MSDNSPLEYLSYPILQSVRFMDKISTVTFYANFRISGRLNMNYIVAD